MTSDYFILLVSLAAAVAGFGLAQLLVSLFRGDKRKLQQRLSTQWRTDVNSLLAGPVRVERAASVADLPPLLADNAILRRLNVTLHAAYPDARLQRFLLLVVMLGMGALLLATLFFDSFLAGGLAGLVAVYLPILQLSAKSRSRQRRLADQLPDALDFLSRVLKAGHSLSTGIQMMGQELREPIASAFRRCYDQHSLGQPLEDAMREMAVTIDSTDFAFFVTAVLIQRQTGGDLSEVLGNIANTVRSRIRLQQRVKAITAEGRLTGYVLVAFPVILFLISYVLNPAYAGVLLTTSTGKTLLGAALFLQMIGLLAIRKVVNIKV